MIDVQHLRKEFTNVVAVDDVSFKVQRGEIYGLIGPNGAGKTTTIRMLMNIIRPDRGSIFIDGKPSNELTKNLVGYLPEERGLYRKNKLIHAISYLGSLKGLTQKEAKSRAMPLLEKFQLADYANRKIEELSKGNQQKVQFIISILHDPPILVLDELFTGLDPINQELMKDILLSLKRENRAIIFSTHQMDQAEKLCDDLCLINKGKMILNGAPSAIKERFGKNSVRIEFDGSLSSDFIFQGVKKSSVYGSYAELELDADTSSNNFLSDVMRHVEVRKYERVEPSLHSIFIDVVGESDISDQKNHHEAVVKKPHLISQDKRVKKAFISFIILCIATLITALVPIKNLSETKSVAAMLGVFTLITLFQYISARKKVAKEMLQQSLQEDQR